MEIKLTWHLLIMIVITVFLIICMFKIGESDMDFNGCFMVIIVVIIWSIYGGIVYW